MKMVEYKNGDYVTCTINGKKITDARIRYVKSSKNYYICQNEFDGEWTTGLYKFGYKYAWCFTPDSDFDVKNIKIIDVNSINEDKYLDSTKIREDERNKEKREKDITFGDVDYLPTIEKQYLVDGELYTKDSIGINTIVELKARVIELNKKLTLHENLFKN